MAVQKRTFYDSGSITMTANLQPQREVTVEAYGDIRAFIIEITQSTTGSLTTASKRSYAVDSININDKTGVPIWSGVRGRDLAMLHLYGNNGNSISETDTSSSSGTDTYYVPFRVDLSAQPAKMVVNIAPYSDMAASGATGGTVQVAISAVYDDSSEDNSVERIHRIQKSLSSGTNSYGPDLLRGRKVFQTYFKVGTESNLTNVSFSSDGRVELDQFTRGQIIGFENAALIDGHQTGIFQLYHTPYAVSEKSRLDFQGGGSDTVQLFLRMRD